MSCVSMFVIWTAFQSIQRHRGDGLGFTTTTNWIFLWDWIDIFWVIWTPLMILAGFLHSLSCICESLISFFHSSFCEWQTWQVKPGRILQVWTPKTSSRGGSKEAGEGGWSASDGLVAALHTFLSFYCIAQGHFTGAARTKESIFAHISSPSPSSRGFSCCFKHTESTPVPRTSIKPAQLGNFHMEMHKHAPWHRTDNRQIVPAVHFLCSYSGAGEDQQSRSPAEVRLTSEHRRAWRRDLWLTSNSKPQLLCFTLKPSICFTPTEAEHHSTLRWVLTNAKWGHAFTETFLSTVILTVF